MPKGNIKGVSEGVQRGVSKGPETGSGRGVKGCRILSAERGSHGVPREVRREY